MILVGFLARALMWVCLGAIVVDAVITLWQDNNQVLAVFAGIFFPITVFVWPFYPWGHEVFGIALWIVFLVGLGSYWLSQLGGQPALDRPGQF